MAEALDLMECKRMEEECNASEDNASKDSTCDPKAIATSESEEQEDEKDTLAEDEKDDKCEPGSTDEDEKDENLEPTSTDVVDKITGPDTEEASEVAIGEHNAKENISGLGNRCPVTGVEDDARCCSVANFKLPSSLHTTFDKHPGGQAHLDVASRQKCAGLLFLSYHMGADLDGKVSSASRAHGTDLPQRGQMYDEMHAAIREVKAAHPNQHLYFQFYCGFLTLLVPMQACFWVISPSLSRALFLAVGFVLYFLNIFHTRHHQGGRIYDNDFLHSLTQPMYDFIDATWGYYPKAWHVNHHVKHHVYTNDTDTDTDVPAVYPYIRSCYDQQRLWFHKFQSFYWILLTPFAAVNFPVNNILVHGGSLFHFSSWIFIMFVLPVALHGPKGLFQSVCTQGFAGCTLAYKFAVSHAHPDLNTTPTSQESYDCIDAWIRAQMEESISYGGYFTTFVFGGINMQVEHHICPALDPPMYYYIAPEIKRIAQKHGIKYNFEPTLLHAVWSFHAKLQLMGRA